MKKMLVAILAATMIFGVLLLLPQAGYAAPIPVGPRANNYPDPLNAVYVSTTGNDATATGAIDKPYQSINAALTKAGAGGTVVLRGGTYVLPADTEVRIVNPNVTIKSAQGEWAHINLPFPANIKDQNKGHCTVRFDPDAHGSKLQAVEVSGGFYCIVLNTTWDWGLEFYPTRYGVSNIIVEDCVLHDARYEVVKVKPNCDNITFRYNEIYNPARAEINDENWAHGEAHAEAIDNVNGDNMLVQNNYMHDVNIALYAKGGAADCIFENNRIEDCDGAGIVIGFDTTPSFFDLTVNPNYYESIRAIVRNNLIINSNWEGIGLYAAKDAQVHNNTLVNVARGYTGTGGFSSYDIHSALYFGIATQDWDNPAGCPPSVNPNIHHNIVIQNSSKNLPMLDVRFIKDFRFDSGLIGDLSSLQGMPTMHDNCYFVSGKSAWFRDNRPSSPLASGNLAAWKTHIGGDTGSIEVNPALDSNYLPTNAQCVGMGITGALVVTPGPVVPPVEYTVTYNAGGGTVSPTSATVTAGNAVTLPTPTRSGYTCNGWFTAASGGTKIGNAGQAYTPTASVTLYAQWTAVSSTQYTVTYNANGGIVNPTSATINIGAATVLPTPARTGYNFAGWFTAASGGTKVGIAGQSYTPTGNVTLYAQWTPFKFTIKYYNGTTLLKTVTANYDSPLNGGSYAPAKTGYNFAGWYTAASGGTKVEKVTKNQSVYARYAIKYYTVKFYRGSTLYATESIKYKGAPIAGPAKTGYKFIGWYTAASGGTKVTSITKSQSLYARYQIKKYTVSYYNGSTLLKKVTVNYNSALMAGPAKTGYTFVGWFDAKTGGTQYTKVPAKNITLYARYQIKSYTVNYYDGSTLVLSQKQNYNSAVIAGPAKTGYKFTGWYDAKTGGTKITKITKNITLYARYVKI